MEATDTDQVNSDADAGLEEKTEIVETGPVEGETEGEVKTEAGTDGTAPNADALEESHNAYKYREANRRAKKLEEENAALKAQMSVKAVEKPELPDYDKFENVADYNTAMSEYHEKLTDWKLEQRDSLNSEKAAQNEYYDRINTLNESYNNKAEEAAKEHPDYYDKVEKNMFTTAMEEAIKQSENSAKIAYHLANNQELNNKLLDASPVATAIEINKLDMRITQGLKSKKTSSAPDPINPVQGNDTVKKDVGKMSAQEYYDAKQAGLIK